MDKLLQLLHDIVHHMSIHPEKQAELHQAIDQLVAPAPQEPAASAPEEPKAES